MGSSAMSTVDHNRTHSINLTNTIPENKNIDETEQNDDNNEMTAEKQLGIIKYIYVIGVFVFAGILTVLPQIWDDFDTFLDEGQTTVTDFFLDLNNSVLWIILCIAVTTLMKAV